MINVEKEHDEYILYLRVGRACDANEEEELASQSFWL